MHGWALCATRALAVGAPRQWTQKQTTSLCKFILQITAGAGRCDRACVGGPHQRKLERSALCLGSFLPVSARSICERLSPAPGSKSAKPYSSAILVQLQQTPSHQRVASVQRSAYSQRGSCAPAAYVTVNCECVTGMAEGLSVSQPDTLTFLTVGEGDPFIPAPILAVVAFGIVSAVYILGSRPLATR